MSKHIHADIIKQWADGAEIEVKNTTWNGWESCPNPQWGLTNQYRVKQKKVTKWLWASPSGLVEYYYRETYNSTYPIKLEWSAQEFDG
jgi:hypothetical protein